MEEAKNYSVLYVEDEVDIRAKYSLYLKRFFKNVYEAGDGKEAYKIYKEKKPDIMVIDIHLPLMSGLELLRMIRVNDHNTKAIMLTAHSDTKYLLDSIELRLTKYLIKPVDRETLHGALMLATEELTKFNSYSRQLLNFHDGYRWDCNSRELFCENELVSLTKNETEFFSLLALRPNQTISYDNICYTIWPDDINDKHSALKTLVKGLRKKLPEETLENIRSSGYKLNIV
ncbi:MAG: response regulator transcription factor [Sulfurimonas sp.]|nr:response regulator transcription factor [Sulfurimonas sp.]